MAKIIGGTTSTPMRQPDWNQTDPQKADYIKNKPFDSVDESLSSTSTNPVQNKAVYGEIENMSSFVNGASKTASHANTIAREAIDVANLAQIAADKVDNALTATNKRVTTLEGKVTALEQNGTGGNIIVDDALSLYSTNPVQNQAITRRFSHVETRVGAVETTAQTAVDTANNAGYNATYAKNAVDNNIIPRLTALEKNGTGGGGGAIEYNRVNVRDYGAVGDGVADDRQAIIDAFTAAKSMLPCEVYFPAGTYGISNGITVDMAYGTGGLLVRGAGRDITTIKYLDSYNPRRNDNLWYAIRIWPVGRPDIIPDEDDYLHDISYTGLTVYDPDPCAHATHASKGDATQEETHGFDIHCCKGVSVTDCQFITVGDEAIDICFCHDVVVMNNRLVGSPGAGPGGGAISIGDGCKGVVVSGNTVNGSAPDETLADGTIIRKRNTGIAVESLNHPVSEITIVGNTVRNVWGSGISFAATGNGAGIVNLSISENVIQNCLNGIKSNSAKHRSGIKITGNIIADCAIDEGYASDTDGSAFYGAAGISDLVFCNNVVRNTHGEKAYRCVTTGTQRIENNLFVNVGKQALYVSGTPLTVKDCVFDGVFTDGDATTAAIYKSGGNMTVSGCKLLNVHSNRGIQDVNVLEHTEIELANGGYATAGKDLCRVIGGKVNGNIVIKQERAIVQGLTIYDTKPITHAISIEANGVSVTGCNIWLSGKNFKAIYEKDNYTHNIVANNIVMNDQLNASVVIILADNTGTVCANNVDLRTMATA